MLISRRSVITVALIAICAMSSPASLRSSAASLALVLVPVPAACSIRFAARCRSRLRPVRLFKDKLAEPKRLEKENAELKRRRR